MGICMSSAFTSHGRRKKLEGSKNSAKFSLAGHSPSGSVHVPMHQAGW